MTIPDVSCAGSSESFKQVLVIIDAEYLKWGQGHIHGAILFSRASWLFGIHSPDILELRLHLYECRKAAGEKCLPAPSFMMARVFSILKPLCTAGRSGAAS